MVTSSDRFSDGCHHVAPCLCPLSHGACKEPASPAPSLPRYVLDARRRANNRATAQCLRRPPNLLPRRRCATAQASDKPRSPACGLLAATASHLAPRQRLRHWLVSPAVAVPPAPTFTLALRSAICPPPAPSASLMASSATPGILSLFAALNCTPPGRGKSQAIEHNRALPKVRQSLRRASLGGLPLRALRVRVMVGYVLRPSPDKGYLGLRLFSQAAQCWRGPLSRWRARALAGVAGGQLVVKVGAGETAHNCKLHWAE